MSGRFRNTWRVTRRCLRMLLRDAWLVLPAVVGFVASVLLTGVLYLPLAAAGFSLYPPPGASSLVRTLYYNVGLLVYLAVAFLATFARATAVAGALGRLRGEEVTLRDAFRAAARRRRELLGW